MWALASCELDTLFNLISHETKIYCYKKKDANCQHYNQTCLTKWNYTVVILLETVTGKVQVIWQLFTVCFGAWLKTLGNLVHATMFFIPEFIVQDFYLDMLYFHLQQPGSSVANAQPYVYLKCGHVHGLHMWNSPERNAADKRTCPVCLQVGELS